MTASAVPTHPTTLVSWNLFAESSFIPQRGRVRMHSIIYLVGLVVIIATILSFLGLR